MTLIRIYHFGKGLFCSDRRNPSYKSISYAWTVTTIDTDYDYDLDSDRSKRLNDILAGHDIALLKMVKKVTLENVLILLVHITSSKFIFISQLSKVKE